MNKPRAKIGDTVVHPRHGYGKIVSWIRGKLSGEICYRVLFRSHVFSIHETHLMYPMNGPPNVARGPDATSMAFRTDPSKRKWEGSYTKRIVDVLKDRWPMRRPESPISKAIELLEQYHRDLHLPYEQRDEARAELKTARDALEFTRSQLRLTQAVLAEKSERLAATRESQRSMSDEIIRLRKLTETHPDTWPKADPAKAGWSFSTEPAPLQFYWACQHHPIALENFFNGIDRCERGCHRSVLKSTDSGIRSAP